MNALDDDMIRLSMAVKAPKDKQELAHARLEKAREILSPVLKEREAPPYPVEALGPLASVCKAIAEAGQMDPALVGQSLLGAASLLTQGLFNVRTLAGTVPLSLYLITLGDSGDGKTTAESTALAAINEWQREQGKKYAEDQKEYKRQFLSRKKGDEPDEEPRSPHRLCRDATVEGLRREFQNGPMSQGLFTSEAAAVLSGYGMNAEQRAKTAGVFNGLWDDGLLSVSRAGAPRVELPGRRLAMHLMIQPSVVAEVFADPMLSSIGFLPRFLAAWPSPSAPRKALPYQPEKLRLVRAYWARCRHFLETELALDGHACPTLELSEDALELLKATFEAFEKAGKRGELKPVKPFAVRAAEQVCRVAGVLAAFGRRPLVSREDLANAVMLVSYSLQTWLALIDEDGADPTPAYALRLYEWIVVKLPGGMVPLVDINKRGPACVRKSKARDAAVNVLVEHELAVVLSSEKQAVELGFVPPAGFKYPALGVL